MLFRSLLDIGLQQGVPVVNSPQALRNHGEKMAALEFPQFTPPTLVASDLRSLKEFAIHHGKVVIKPLDAMGGTGVFVLDAHDPNLPSALEVLSDNGSRSIVAQRYIPEIVDGDKVVKVLSKKLRNLQQPWENTKVKLRINKDMPGLNFKPWKLHGPRCYSVKVDEGNRAHLENLGSGKWLAYEIGGHKELGHG